MRLLDARPRLLNGPVASASSAAAESRPRAARLDAKASRSSDRDRLVWMPTEGRGSSTELSDVAELRRRNMSHHHRSPPVTVARTK